ncbi:MFS general substrate transporter [Rhizoclosmatium globosum]|uniref:MFS general substrate transporter n=1 Tax=Rhizoclosmatium globosum TaxID=329046 RepID=A0A1Y2BIA9_9FUNG|nr:MFS general substrate transporter [Rhizoclosmatium globosum]|eukprot:ORY34531.1 MFS general substrate transporter [Rhizoclosmatium globosum]
MIAVPESSAPVKEAVETALTSVPSTEVDEVISDYPDGGLQAWLVVAGTFIAHFLVFGVIYSFGIYNSYYLNLGIGSAAAVSMIGSVGIALMDLLCISASILAEKFGFRQVIFLGTVFMSLGLFLSSFTTSLPLLICSQGVMFGIGASFIYLPAVSLPAQWFLKKRGLAMGIARWPRWTLRVTAIICLVLMSLFVPFMKTRIPPRKGKADYTFLKKASFYYLFFACFFFTFSEYISVDFIPLYAQMRLGLPLGDQATIMSVYNGSNIAGRLLMGFLSDKYLGHLNSWVICLWVTVIGVCTWLAAASYVSLAVVSAVIGFFDGGFWCLFPVVVAKVFDGDSSLATLLGTTYTLVTIANLAGPPLSGLILENMAWIGWLSLLQDWHFWPLYQEPKDVFHTQKLYSQKFKSLVN